MSAKLLKSIALLLLTLAVISVGLAFWVSNKRLNIQGPSALAVLPDQSVWISVEDALWHLDPNGKRLAVIDAATLGVGGVIGNLIIHPNGQLVASVRDDPTLYFLDPVSATIRSRLVPQWPVDLREHGSRAITYGFHEDGRLAVSTGGGHAVAVFDASGRFLMRSKPGLYQFTNGLWWTSDSLWTTDTNGMALLELNTGTLEVKSRVRLLQHQNGWKYLGMAVSLHGRPTLAGQTAPLVTLVRFANGMVEGHATDVFSNGMQSDYPVASTLEPRDIKWRGDELLLVDAASYAIKRYSNRRTLLPDFGDAEVRDALRGSLERRASLQMQYYAGLVGAVVLFAIGFAAAMRAQNLEKKQALAALQVDLSQLGTPRLSQVSLLLASLRLFWLPVALMGIVMLLEPGLRYFPDFAKSAARPLSLGTLVLYVAAFYLFLRSSRRETVNPAAEAVFNYRAVQTLESELAFWRLRQPGELPRETVMLSGSKGGMQWLVLTNRRLLVFVASPKDRTFLAEYPRHEIASLRLLEPHEMSRWQRWQQHVSLGGAALRFEFKDGTTLQGRTPATVTARRMAALLRTVAFDAPSLSEMSQAQREQARPHARVPSQHEALRQAAASFLLPGLGQRMQGREASSLHFFVVWLLLLLFFVVPLVWTLWAPRAAVSLGYRLYLAGAYVLHCTVAAIDVWRMRTRRL